MLTEREKTVLLVLLVIFSVIGLLVFAKPFWEDIGTLVVLQAGQFRAHREPIVRMAVSRDGTLLATAAEDLTIKIWRLKDRKLLWSFRGHTDTILDLTFSPDGERLVSGSVDMTVRIWSVADGKEVHRLDSRIPGWHTGWVQTVAVSGDGKWLATGSRDTTVKVWTFPDAELKRTLWGHEDTVTDLVFSPTDPKLLASGSTDGTVRVWDVVEGKMVRFFPPLGFNPQSLTFSPDGEYIAVGAYAGMGVRLLRWRSDQKGIWCSGGLEGAVWSLDYSPDGHYLVIGSGDNCIWIYAQRGKECRALRAIRQTVGRRAGMDFWGDVRGVAVLPDGKTIVAAFEDGYVRFWRIVMDLEVPEVKLPHLPEIGGEHRH